MKIISGRLKGRIISGYNIEGTRPTINRVRESLFSIIQDYLPNSIVLDLFSGSGILGLDALSNGSQRCYFNDSNLKCINNIKKLVNDFNIDGQAIITNYDYKKALAYYKNNNLSFDIIFLDPPYNMKCINEIIDFIIKNDLLNDKGIIICEVDDNYLNKFSSLKIVKEKKYNDKYIFMYEKEAL